MLPAVFAKRGPHGISTLAIVASSTGVAFLGLLGFETIVEILNLLCEPFEVFARAWGCRGTMSTCTTIGGKPEDCWWVFCSLLGVRALFLL